ncbi:unnamed protein product [Cylindrotheca closterium]|uniref:Uncharacterized protein n=1 Tax=Cylindrotheca closterium TaxID=2856 RepID=A0AAD2GA27_9STRA|nr:unnamed protein product [Cylindrotheca closterium]
MELAYANNLRSAAANTTNFTADERQQMEAEAARVEALQIAGMATEYLDFAFDGKWYRKTPWSELPAKAKDAAHALNWEVNDDDETAAAAVGSCWYPMETRTWEDLSIEQCNGARTLGFNRHSWKDMFSGYLYIAQDWESLSDEIQASCRVLGWSEEKWGKTILVKEESRQWGALSLNEKEAARALNFELRSWNTMFASDAFENNDDGDY